MLVIETSSLEDMGPQSASMVSGAAASISLGWELVKNTHSQAPPMIHGIRNLGVGPSHLGFNEPLREFCSLQFKNHHFKDVP